MLNRLLGLFGADLAIDLGTANTRISVAGRGLVLNEPSLVAVAQGTHRVLSGGCAVGHLARQMWGRTPESISVVRPLSGGVITDFTLCETMLRYFFRKVQGGRFAPRPRVLIAVPGCITPVERRAVYNSALRAGARQVLLVCQAQAAAIAVGLPLAEPVGNMILSIGAGATDVAIMSLSDTVSQQSIRLGGDQMDQEIVDYLRRRFQLRVSLPEAERLRIEAGCAAPLQQPLATEARGVDTVTGLPRRVTVTSEELREALADSLEAIVDAISRALDDCSPDLAADLSEQGMVLTGGAAQLRELDRFLTERTAIPARLWSDPTSAVASGTLACLENLAHWRGLLHTSDEPV